MRKTLILGLATAVLALGAGSALAGDYHMGASLKCAECHTMHYSKTHDYDGTANPTDLGAGGPFHMLLKASPNEMCLQCHDGQAFAPDVEGANTGSFVRQAGGLTTGAAPYEDWKGHSLGSTDMPPGHAGGTYVVPADGLECISCHHQHGSASGITYPAGYTRGQYRNLVGKPGGVAVNAPLTYAVGSNDTTLDFFERDATLGQVDVHYSYTNVDFNEPDQTKSAYANWCKGCHTDFHGAKGGTEVGGDPATNHDWLRHPSAEVNVGGQSSHGHSGISRGLNKTGKQSYVKLMDPAGAWAYSTATDAAPGEFTPSCFSCHKAHGNQNAFGLIQMDPLASGITEEGTASGASRDLCRQCHVQGG